MRTAALAFLGLLLTGCGSVSRTPPIQIFSDMKHQPKFKAQQENPFFADHRATRAPAPGTVPHEFQAIADERPALTAELMARGEERFNIYCAVCHDRTGSGRGIVATRANWLAADLTEQRIRNYTDEQIYDVITNGQRTMPAYRFQAPVRDRWAIIAYVRALQRAANATAADVPPELRNELR